MKTTTLLTIFGLSILFLAPGAVATPCQNSIPAQNPETEYVTHNDGTVTDLRTGLMWKRCSEGQTWSGTTCTGTGSRHTWSSALAQASSSSFAGHSDWRLPNVKELGSLIEACRTMPAINTVIFPNTPVTPNAAFWTASPTAGLSTSSWFIGFDLGYTLRSGRSGQAMARLVRDSE